MTGFRRWMLAMQTGTKWGMAASLKAWGPKTSYRGTEDLGWQFQGQPGEGTKGQQSPQSSDPRLPLEEALFYSA